MESNWLNHLDAIRPSVDLGMLVLIWLVQLIIYPGFAHMRAETFSPWHKSYMNRMGFIVAPLMLTQPLLIGLQIWLQPELLHLASAALVALAWLATALFSVPAHHHLQKCGYDAAMIQRLVTTNWIRTFAWTGVCLLGLWA
ncbi:MAG: Uncharacterised protein [Opitutia bacterium UBA7350]|nr:MAG: Uncharacterised protein [Opitutae bacterium UBA7350]